VHCVIGKHEKNIGGIVGHIKIRATQAIRAETGWPVNRPVWSGGFWKVFLDNSDDVERAVEYVNANPEKDGMGRQNWSFVKPFVY
jgi:hypothetical protein